MSIGEKLSYAYIKRVKRWMECPVCHQRMTFNKSKSSWICKECNYEITEEDFLDDFVLWFCDECNSYLNNQEGFDKNASKHVCNNCGFENDTTFDNLKGTCVDCGKLLPNPDVSLCDECKDERKQKVKEKLLKAGKAVGTVAFLAGTTYIASKGLEGEEDSNISYYPTCKSCGTMMSEFDGVAWYTCPECGNSVRIIDGSIRWYDEIFKPGTKEHYSDYDLADFCRGGDLSED